MTAAGRRPRAWAVLELALAERRPVRVRYHGEHRVVCPHALGWKDGRAKVLAYQVAGATSHGPLPSTLVALALPVRRRHRRGPRHR